jgi:hypothetical protein
LHVLFFPAHRALITRLFYRVGVMRVFYCRVATSGGMLLRVEAVGCGVPAGFGRVQAAGLAQAEGALSVC